MLNYYLDGGTNGDSLMFSKAFLPEGLMLFMRNDSLQVISLKDFMARARNNGQKTNRTTKIESIEVFGDAAMAKLTIDFATARLHDIMSLLKTKDGWKIAGKIFSREVKTAGK
ncbi:MAG: nuclear transport factor 2 family protein [Chitinophagaceae bacterium]|nr:nuclear transport factor 2 family protein [Chitinophagaceae bacterium]